MRAFLPVTLTAALLMTGAGCALKRYPTADTHQASFAVGPFPAYRTAPIPPSTRIFLVAGGSSLANFLQEVVDQRAHWLSAGYRPRQIACYYVHPSLEDYLEDKAQFDALAPSAKGFYEADPELIARHLRSIGEKSPKFVYFYSTSHGVEPSDQLPDYTLMYDRDPQRVDRSFAAVYPAFLKRALSQLPAETEKWVVLQACHAGGFIDPGPSRSSTDSLKAVPNVRVFAASRYDRPSFGCSASQQYTYYGLAFIQSLQEQPRKLKSLDADLLHSTVVHRIDVMENTFEIPPDKQSEPVMFSNVPD